MRVIVTCGPAWEPIDAVRRITNFSTGEIGTLLSEALTVSGHEVLCFRGQGSTFPTPEQPVKTSPFTTNESLLDLLQADHGEIGAVFHAAALSDFAVASMEQKGAGRAQGEGKMDSRSGEIHLRLAPKPKLIVQLRRLFPLAVLVGWKYAVEGGLQDAEQAALHQMNENKTDACVLNGPAIGSGFRFYLEGEPAEDLPDKAALVAALVREFERRNR